MGNRLVPYCDICKKDLDLDSGYALRMCKMSDVEKLYSQESHNDTTYFDLCRDCMNNIKSYIKSKTEN